jgi:hypothetical protein
VTRGWRKLYRPNAALHNFETLLFTKYYYSYENKEDRMGGGCSMHGENWECLHFVGNPEGMRTLGRSRRRWEDNIKMDLTEIG